MLENTGQAEPNIPAAIQQATCSVPQRLSTLTSTATALHCTSAGDSPQQCLRRQRALLQQRSARNCTAQLASAPSTQLPATHLGSAASHSHHSNAKAASAGTPCIWLMQQKSSACLDEAAPTSLTPGTCTRISTQCRRLHQHHIDSIGTHPRHCSTHANAYIRPCTSLSSHPSSARHGMPTPTPKRAARARYACVSWLGISTHKHHTAVEARHTPHAFTAVC